MCWLGSNVCLFIRVIVLMLRANICMMGSVCVCYVVSSWKDRVCNIRDYHHGLLSLGDPLYGTRSY